MYNIDLSTIDEYSYRVLSQGERQYLIKQLMTSDAFATLVPEVIDEAIQTYFEPELRGRRIVNIKRGTSPYISWLQRFGGTGADFVGEGEEPPRITIRYAKKTIRPTRIAVSFEITDTMIQDVGLDIYNDHLQTAVKDVARKENYFIFSVINNSVANGTPGFTGYVYDSHIIDASKYTSSNLDHEKIEDAMRILSEEDITPDVAVLSPAQFSELQKLTEFRDTNGVFQYLPPRAARIVEEGVREAFGIPITQVVVDRNIPPDTVIFFDKTNYVDLYEYVPLTIATQRNELTFSGVTVLHERLACAPRNPAYAVKIKNLSYTDITSKQ